MVKTLHFGLKELFVANEPLGPPFKGLKRLDLYGTVLGKIIF